jgi:hypothetical protein
MDALPPGTKVQIQFSKENDMEQEQKSQRTERANNVEWIIEAITWTLVASVFMFS